MESGPSKVAETIVGYLLPPACREEILGDMRERHRSGLGYFVEALQVIPFVVYSRIGRTNDAVVAPMEVVSMYTAFVVVAKWVDPTLISADSGLARLAIPSAVVLAVMSLADAYSDPQRRWPLKPLFAPTLGFAVAYIEQSMYVQWSLPRQCLLRKRDRLDIRLDTAGGISHPLPTDPKPPTLRHSGRSWNLRRSRSAARVLWCHAQFYSPRFFTYSEDNRLEPRRNLGSCRTLTNTRFLESGFAETALAKAIPARMKSDNAV